MEENRSTLMALAVQEAKKTIPDALSEVREAIDFCRYYSARAIADLVPVELPGPTGERNVLRHEGRGVWVAIAPWNFPLAIFLGQVAAALVAGNTVVAKPAPQTPAIAAIAVSLAHQAGVPADALQLVTGAGDVGAQLTVRHPHFRRRVYRVSPDRQGNRAQSLARRRPPAGAADCRNRRFERHDRRFHRSIRAGRA